MLKVTEYTTNRVIGDVEPGTLFRMHTYPNRVYMVLKKMKHSSDKEVPVAEFCKDKRVGLNGFLPQATIGEILGIVEWDFDL